MCEMLAKHGLKALIGGPNITKYYQIPLYSINFY